MTAPSGPSREYGGAGYQYNPITGMYDPQPQARPVKKHHFKLKLILLGLVGLLALIGASAVKSHLAGSDKAACATYASTLNLPGSPSASQYQAGVEKAAGQAVSQPLKGDLQTLATDYGNVGGNDLDTDMTAPLNDCASLGYPDNNN